MNDYETIGYGEVRAHLAKMADGYESPESFHFWLAMQDAKGNIFPENLLEILTNFRRAFRRYVNAEMTYKGLRCAILEAITACEKEMNP